MASVCPESIPVGTTDSIEVFSCVAVDTANEKSSRSAVISFLHIQSANEVMFVVEK